MRSRPESLLRGLALLLASPLAAGETAPATLLISLDAVPYRVVADLTDPALGEAALFEGFAGPVPLISTFPSSTSVALVGLLRPLGLDNSPGYEARFFDWQQQQVRGGGPLSYHRIPFAWREFFDWTRRGPVGSAIEALRPVRSGIKRLRRAIGEFVDSEEEVLLVYLAATDTAVHVVGPEAVKELFHELDAMLSEARRARADRPFETIIFSDHGVSGGEPLDNLFRPVRSALASAEFRITSRLRSPRDVVITPFGLVSNFEAYTREAIKAEVAAVLVGIEGVDVCAYQEADGWRLAGDGGRAAFDRRVSEEGVLWRYRVDGIDPLDYLPVIQELSSRSPELDGWVRDEELYEATLEAFYPDALHRITHAFDLVTNPASVVCSLGPGFMFGAPRTDLLARLGKGPLRWTHGALHRDATLGFLMSDAAAWEPPVAARFDRCLLPFRKALSRHPQVSLPAADESPRSWSPCRGEGGKIANRS